MQSAEDLAFEIAGMRNHAVKFFVPEIIEAISARDAEWQARDAEIRRECAERAQDEWEQLFCDDMIGDREFVTKKLRAAIKGAAHE